MTKETNKTKPGLAADTCSLIFLYRSGLLAGADKFYTLYITPLIYMELEKRADKNEMRIYQNSTRLLDMESIKEKPLIQTNVSDADKSLIVLYHVIKGEAVLSEDGKLLKYCKKNGIPHYCCLSLAAGMAGKGFITHNAALRYMNKIKKIGRYSDWVIETAYKILEAG